MCAEIVTGDINREVGNRRRGIQSVLIINFVDTFWSQLQLLNRLIF